MIMHHKVIIELMSEDDRSQNYQVVTLDNLKCTSFRDDFVVLKSDKENGMRRMFDFIAHKLD